MQGRRFSTRSHSTRSSISHRTRHAHASNPALASTTGLIDSLPRVRLTDLAPGEFAARFERPRLPCVITDAADTWPCPPSHPLWTPAGLASALGPSRLKVGTDDDGRGVRLGFDDFLDYCADPGHGRADDSPLYVFDGGFADSETESSDSDGGSGSGRHRRKKKKKKRAGPGAAIAAAYAVPPPFSEDLLSFAGPHRRPPHRWLVVGPPRSGSGLHVDPLATAAWNTLLAGRKRWALFPPGTPPALVAPREAGVGREAADWFAAVHPRTAAPGWPGPPALDCVQAAGETVYVPGGWWHAVLNLPSAEGGGGAGRDSSAWPDLSIAVTQNFVSSANFARVWPAAAVGRPRMAAAWLRALDKGGRSDLTQVAVALTGAGLERGSGSSSSSSSSSSSDADDDEGRAAMQE